MTMTFRRCLKRSRVCLDRWIGRRVGRFAEDTEGVAIVEFAFMMPILIIALLMIITLSHMMMVDRKLTITAQAATDLISQRQAVDADDINEIRLAAGLMMQPFTADFDISVAHVPFLLPGGAPDMSDAAAWRALINGAVQISDAEAETIADGGQLSTPPSAVTGPLGTPGDALIILRMDYRYRSMWVGDFSFAGINIPAVLTFTRYAFARPRLNRQITASDTVITSAP